jgi:hypothetical protein
VEVPVYEVMVLLNQLLAAPSTAQRSHTEPAVHDEVPAEFTPTISPVELSTSGPPESPGWITVRSTPTQ